MTSGTSLIYQGEIIRDAGDMLSLTDMWKAAGSDPSRKPSEWLDSVDGRRFIEFLSDSLGLEVGNSRSQLVVAKKGGRGVGGSTFAHWQIALAYAKYLSPEFHMWCNDVVRRHMEGHQQVAPLSLPSDLREMIRRDDGISRMLAHKVTGLEASMAALVNVVATIASVVQPPGDGVYLTGKTAGEIWRGAGFPRMRVTSWFSNRLCEMGCQMEGHRRVPVGLGRAKLFDQDKAENWLRNGGGRAFVERYIQERKGQHKLRLVPPTDDRGGEGKSS